MKSGLRLFAAALLAAPLALPTATPAPAQPFTGEQRGEIERIIREYLLKNPELLQEVMTELEKKQAAAKGMLENQFPGHYRLAVEQYIKRIAERTAPPRE